ncbi:hypothetical protein VIGAN_08217600, partial [Vigna angularis var. angularis]
SILRFLLPHAWSTCFDLPKLGVEGSGPDSHLNLIELASYTLSDDSRGFLLKGHDKADEMTSHFRGWSIFAKAPTSWFIIDA